MKEYMIAVIKRDEKLHFLPLRRKYWFCIPGPWRPLSRDYKNSYDEAYKMIENNAGKI